MLDQKSIIKAWNRRLNCEASEPWMKNAALSYSKTRGRESFYSLKKIVQKNKRCRTWVWGDNWLCLEGQMQMLEMLEHTQGRPGSLIADRWHRKDAQLIQNFFSKKIGIKELKKNLQKIGLHTLDSDILSLFFAQLKKLQWNVHLISPSSDKVEFHSPIWKEAQKAIKSTQHLVWIWTGSLRISPALTKNILPDEERVFLSMYPQLNQVKRNHSWKMLRGDYFLYQDLTPYYSLECIRLSRQGKVAVLPDSLEKHFRDIQNKLISEFKMKKNARGFKIYHPFSGEKLRALRSIKMPRAEMNFLRQRWKKGENLVMPHHNKVFLFSLDYGELAEEAAHQLRIQSKTGQYGFMQTVVEECFGFMASLFFDDCREIPKLQELSKQKLWTQAHYLGYSLGLALFASYTHGGRHAKNRIRSLWNAPCANEEQAQLLVTQMKDV
ncbi:MAG: hypothetical protein KDD52_02520 [Bdellovibrionales bacterium]|nr:hypothetical protein [Bdellovibrionales bacterium]